ncbi:MAG: hypothetical protein JNK33_05440 [Candidatus Doudnabacteria bacterium]|nr:hypothetical protein [Candidatus Doudnabacteria bacterium]
MDSITTRYKEPVSLQIDSGDVTSVTASIYIGVPGQPYILTKSCSLSDGVGVIYISEDEMLIPVGNYSYQINIEDSMGRVEKYPSPEDGCQDCSDKFPDFIVCEALDIS